MMRLNNTASIILVALALAFGAGVSAHANVVGADTQNFNPTPDGLDFVTVHSSETLQPGVFNFGFFLNYAVNSLPNYENTTTGDRTNFKDSLLSSDLNFAAGIMRNWEAGLSFPMLLSQDVDSDLNTFRGEFASTGLTEIRAMTKYRFWGNAQQGIAGIFSVNMNQIEDNPFTGTDAGPTYNFEVAADTTFNRFAVGGNIGYRLRNPGDQLAGIPVEPFGDQIILSTAVSYLFPDWDTKIIAELFGSFLTEDQQFISDRSGSTAEFLLGMKTDITRELAFHAGAGTEVIHGTSSPDWRVYTGINWAFGPLFSQPKEDIVRVDHKDKDYDAIIKELEDIDPYEEPPKAQEMFVGRDVLFKFNSDELSGGALVTLQRFADYVRQPPGLKMLTIEGHTDSVGPAIYNLNLSQRRANSVRRALVNMGLPANRVKAIGYGESEPIADNGNYQGRAANRRVEFNVQR